MAQGNFPVVTMRKLEQVEEFNKIYEGKGFAIQMDITNDEQRSILVETVIKNYGHVDFLINNAGYGIFGAAEEISNEQHDLMMATNHSGPVKLTKAFLPHMRDAYINEKRESLVFLMSSIAAQLSAPGLSAYNESKAALESFGVTIEKELKSLGVSVFIPKPGPFRTRWADTNAVIAANQIEAYDDTDARKFPQMMLEEWNGKQPGDPVEAVKLILKLMEDKNRPVRYVLG